jgi:hypothetical protein
MTCGGGDSSGNDDPLMDLAPVGFGGQRDFKATSGRLTDDAVTELGVRVHTPGRFLQPASVRLPPVGGRGGRRPLP